MNGGRYYNIHHRDNSAYESVRSLNSSGNEVKVLRTFFLLLFMSDLYHPRLP